MATTNNYSRHSVEPTSIRRRSAETGRRSPSMQRKFQRYATQIKTDTDCATSHLPLDDFSSTSPYFIYIKVSLPQAASVVEAIKIAWRGCSKRSFLHIFGSSRTVGRWPFVMCAAMTAFRSIVATSGCDRYYLFRPL